MSSFNFKALTLHTNNSKFSNGHFFRFISKSGKHNLIGIFWDSWGYDVIWKVFLGGSLLFGGAVWWILKDLVNWLCQYKIIWLLQYHSFAFKISVEKVNRLKFLHLHTSKVQTSFGLLKEKLANGTYFDILRALDLTKQCRILKFNKC